MFTAEELMALLSAVAANTMSLFGGFLGIIFTVLSAFRPDSQKRVLLTIGALCMFLSPSFAWLDLYRAHEKEKKEWDTAIVQKGTIIKDQKD